MKLKRVIGVLKQEYFITIRSVEVMVDVLFFPLVNIVVFGFLSLYLSGGTHALAGEYVLLGMLLWQIIWIIEYSVTLGSLWNIWSRNLSNMFIAPLEFKEYILAHSVSGIVKAVMLLGLGGILSHFVFGFDLLSIGLLPLALVFINFSFFAFSVGITVLGLLFRYGTRIQALSWSLITIFQPLSAAFFPLYVLPAPIQLVSKLFPSTYTFEAARYALVNHAVEWNYFGIAFVENIFYFILSIIFFAYMFKVSRDTGQFVRNEA